MSEGIMSMIDRDREWRPERPHPDDEWKKRDDGARQPGRHEDTLPDRDRPPKQR